MKKLLLLVLVVCLPSKAFSRGSPRPTIPAPSPTETRPETTIAKGAHFSPVYNYTTEQKDVLVVSEKLVNDLIQSQCFEKFMVSRPLIGTNGKTPLQVVQDLKAQNLTVPVRMYYKRWSNVVGFRAPPDPTINTNWKYHAGATACSRGSNIAHEWSHVGGYEHSFKATPTRPFSVPYSINAAFEACCSCVGNSIKNCSVK